MVVGVVVEGVEVTVSVVVAVVVEDVTSVVVVEALVEVVTAGDEEVTISELDVEVGPLITVEVAGSEVVVTDDDEDMVWETEIGVEDVVDFPGPHDASTRKSDDNTIIINRPGLILFKIIFAYHLKVRLIYFTANLCSCSIF